MNTDSISECRKKMSFIWSFKCGCPELISEKILLLKFRKIWKKILILKPEKEAWKNSEE